MRPSSAHLGFKLEAKTAKPLVACEPLLHDVPQSRLFDEMLKLLQTGHAMASIEQLQKLGLARRHLPAAGCGGRSAPSTPLVQAALRDTDRRVAEGKPVAPSFLLACVLWQDVQDRLAAAPEQGRAQLSRRCRKPSTRCSSSASAMSSGRGKLAADMREIWVMQPRFDKRTGPRPSAWWHRARFRAGFDFLRLRADVGDAEEALANWWQVFQYADEVQRRDLMAQARDGAAPKKTSRAKKRPRPAAPSVPRATGRRRRQHRARQKAPPSS